MKRIYRNDMSQRQKENIAQKLTGRKMSEETKEKISKSMRKYWAKLPTRPLTAESEQNLVYNRIGLTAEHVTRLNNAINLLTSLHENTDAKYLAEVKERLISNYLI